jgi:signal transduction histidine kinase
MSMSTDLGPTAVLYSAALAEYFATRSEAALYHASLLGKECVERGLGPEEIIALHTEALEASIDGLSYRQRAGAAVDALQFLLEVMIAYGVHHQRYLELRLQEQRRLVEQEGERDRQRARELEQADRIKGEVMGAIAHELRTPITAVRGYLDMAARALSRDRAADVPQLVTSARRALDRLTRLTADLTEASRGEPPPLEFRPINLANIVVEACSWAQPAANEKGVALDAERIESSLPVRGDANALTTVVTNLLTNAIRYTPAGGRVTVEAQRNDGTVAVQVRDTGIGMSDDVQAHIFDKFYRSPEARAVEAQGLGIGLFLTRQLVRAHNGEITVTSTAGAGSTFRVTVPLLPDPSEEDVHG